ncbi:PIG-L family deacetylase [Streptomyces sp. NPDC001634]
MTANGLPDGIRRVPAVVAHPDDESFGRGGLPVSLSERDVRTSVLCFTRGEASGEASTPHGTSGELRTVRAYELDRAAREPGAERVELADHSQD